MSSLKNIYSSEAYVNVDAALADDDDFEDEEEAEVLPVSRRSHRLNSSADEGEGSERDNEEWAQNRKKELNGLEIKYNTQIKRRPTRHPILTQSMLSVASEVPVKLVPIRLDLEVENLKLKDNFTWNLNETLLTPEQFAQMMVEDLNTPYAAQLAPLIAGQIRQQCSNYSEAVEEDTRLEVLKAQPDGAEEEEGGFEDFRIVIKIDFNIGSISFTDQFEWPLFSRLPPTPEDFARQLCSELGVAGHFVGNVAHQIREQLCSARLNFDEAIFPPEFRRPFRPVDELEEHGEWEPEIREMTADEIEKLLKEQDRSSRRLRRSQKLTRASSYMSSSMPYGARTSLGGNYNHSMNTSLWRNQYQQAYQPKIPYQNYQPKTNEPALQHNVTPQNSFVPPPFSIMAGASGSKESLADKRRKSNAGAASQTVPPLDTDLIKNQIELMMVHNIPQGGAPPNSAPSSAGSNGSGGPPANIDPEKPNIEEQTRRMSTSSENSQRSVGPRKHRGFGASARVFNEDGSLDVGEFRKNWRCSWCLLSGKFTPTLRKGPLGSKTLCNACGIWYVKHGSMPEERYREHADTQ